MSFKIYTKTGDKGKTSLLGGKRVYKNHIQVESYGTVDELNAYLGLAVSKMKDHKDFQQRITDIQRMLFLIGSYLSKNDDDHFPLAEIKEEYITNLENQIDSMEEELETLQNFILPGGCFLASVIHVSRTICRRAERNCISVYEHSPSDSTLLIIKYLNRLSDFLFVFARYINHKNKIKEAIWTM